MNTKPQPDLIRVLAPFRTCCMNPRRARVRAPHGRESQQSVAYNFLPVERDQSFLLPPSMTDWLPEDHLAFFVLDVVENMDLRPFYLGYRQDGWGGAAHEPRMMAALLLYA